MPRLLIWLAILLSAAACAGRRPTAVPVAAVREADALVAAGCYDCLVAALATYERLAPRLAEARRGAFETAVLLTVRARELGLPDDSWMVRARALAPDLDAEPARLAPAVYLDALQLIAGEMSGLSPDERERRAAERRKLLPADGMAPPARTALAAATADPVAAYLRLAIDCENARALKELDLEALAARTSMPLLQYRIALCARDIDRLAALRASDPRWRDTLFFEARREMTRYPAPDLGKGAELLAAAHEAFGESPAITLALGSARNALNEYAPALELFDRALADEPAHRDALLGRLLSLSYLNRHYTAIGTATRLIELGTYHMGDAYYWRAWNRYHTHDLTAAWDDVEHASKLMVNTAVYTLAGYIAYARRELETAIDRLSRAYKLDPENCDAVWTEGLVHVDREDWKQAGPRFGTAAGCFVADARKAHEELLMVQQTSWAEPIKERRMAAARKRADASQHRHAQSAYNAAGSYARLAQKAEALNYLAMAAEHPLLKEKAAALRISIEKLP